ncbi:MAG: invasion associated locus B family protein [Alphaproteobacteria bacterium]|nr:invasion associated locus B family protein [Alphaproteobacteria bacterium]
MKKKLLNGYVIGLGLALIAAISVWASVGHNKQDVTLAAQDSGVLAKTASRVEPPRTFKDWRLLCTVPGKDGKKQCQIIQVLSEDGKKSVALTTIVHAGQIKEKPVAVMIFMLPLGTLLPPGMTLKVDDDKEIRIPYQQCRKGGCLVRVAVDKDRLDKIKTGKSMFVGYKVMNGKGKVAQVPLNGFAQALDAMMRESSKEG